MDKVDYEAWAVEMCTLLDAIEIALSEDDPDWAKLLVAGRFEIAERNGLTIHHMGQGAPMQ